MATQTVDVTFFTSSHPDITKRTNVSRLIISVGIMLVGILIFASISGMSGKPSTLGMGLMVLGTALILLGVFRLFQKSKETVYLLTGSVAKEHSLFFGLKHIGKLTGMLESSELDGETGVKSESNGNVRLDVMISQDNKFAALQSFQFVPYTYTPVISVCYFTGSEAAAVSVFLSRCKAM